MLTLRTLSIYAIAVLSCLAAYTRSKPRSSEQQPVAHCWQSADLREYLIDSLIEMSQLKDEVFPILMSINQQDCVPREILDGLIEVDTGRSPCTKLRCEQRFVASLALKAVQDFEQTAYMLLDERYPVCDSTKRRATGEAKNEVIGPSHELMKKVEMKIWKLQDRLNNVNNATRVVQRMCGPGGNPWRRPLQPTYAE